MKTLDKSNSELWAELEKRQARIEELETALRWIVQAVEEEGQSQYDCADIARNALTPAS